MPRAGLWELIRFEDLDNGQKVSEKVYLNVDDPIFAGARLLRCPDLENDGRCLALTAVDGDGNAVWGKLRED